MLTSSMDGFSTARLFLDDDEEEGFTGGNSVNGEKKESKLSMGVDFRCRL